MTASSSPRRTRCATGSSSGTCAPGYDHGSGSDLDRRRGRVGARRHPRAGSTLRGRTRVGSGSLIGPMTTLIDATVGERVRPHSYLTGARSPTAPRSALRLPAPGRPDRRGRQGGHLRRDQELGDRRRRQGAAPSYIGDAEVGEDSASAPARSPPTTTVRASTGPRSAEVNTGVGHVLRCPRRSRRRGIHWCRLGDRQDVPPGPWHRTEQANVEGYAEKKASDVEGSEDSERDRGGASRPPRSPRTTPSA